ncbi:MAG: YkvA family protein [Fimbriimonadaceae bacterium]
MNEKVRILPPGQRAKPNRAGLIPLLIAFLYGASPIDLIPDLIPLLGWSDDVVVVVICLTIAFKLWRRRAQSVSSAYPKN